MRSPALLLIQHDVSDRVLAEQALTELTNAQLTVGAHWTCVVGAHFTCVVGAQMTVMHP